MKTLSDVLLLVKQSPKLSTFTIHIRLTIIILLLVFCGAASIGQSFYLISKSNEQWGNASFYFFFFFLSEHMNFSRTLVFLRSKISWSPYVQKLNGTNKEVLGILNYKGRRSFLVLALLFYKHNGYGFNINSIKNSVYKVLSTLRCTLQKILSACRLQSDHTLLPNKAFT